MLISSDDYYKEPNNLNLKKNETTITRLAAQELASCLETIYDFDGYPDILNLFFASYRASSHCQHDDDQISDLNNWKIFLIDNNQSFNIFINIYR